MNYSIEQNESIRSPAADRYIEDHPAGSYFDVMLRKGETRDETLMEKVEAQFAWSLLEAPFSTPETDSRTWEERVTKDKSRRRRPATGIS